MSPHPARRRRFAPPSSRCLLSLLTGAVFGLAAASTGSAAPGVETVGPLASSAALREAVTVDAMVGHLDAWQGIADAHGGNRTAGSSGERASVDYAAARLREAGYAVRLETFTFPVFEETRPPSLTLLDGGTREAVEVRSMIFSGAGSVTAPLWPAGTGAAADTETLGCRSSDYAGMPRGAVALVRRGECWVDRKVARAAEAGAAAIMVYDRGGSDRVTAFRAELDEPAAIPAVTLTHDAGVRLAAAARQGRTEVRLGVEARVEQRPTRNLLAEMPTGDPGQVVLVGAHLDSVSAGPGINDNATGAAAVLEIALQTARLGIVTPNRLRFAFWGAEENGLFGSSHHADALPPHELRRLAAVLNFDMLGSPNYARLVYDGDGSSSDEAGPPGSARIESLFRGYFAAVGLSVAEIDLEDGSDHLSFVEHDVPVGGLVAGDGELKSPEEAALFGGAAGEPYDPCFHEACDRLAAVNRTALDELSDAAAHMVLVLGSDPQG